MPKPRAAHGRYSAIGTTIRCCQRQRRPSSSTSSGEALAQRRAQPTDRVRASLPAGWPSRTSRSDQAPKKKPWREAGHRGGDERGRCSAAREPPAGRFVTGSQSPRISRRFRRPGNPRNVVTRLHGGAGELAPTAAVVGRHASFEIAMRRDVQGGARLEGFIVARAEALRASALLNGIGCRAAGGIYHADLIGWPRSIRRASAREIGPFRTTRRRPPEIPPPGSAKTELSFPDATFPR